MPGKIWIGLSLLARRGPSATFRGRLTLEFETDLVNTVDHGMKMVDDVGQENVGLLLDTFHMKI